MKSYDYKKRKGIKKISWESFYNYCKRLAEKASNENFDVIIGLARGGLFPATTISCMLRKEFFPVRISRREGDVIKYKRPSWKVDISDKIKNKKVLIVDDVADTGETLSLVVKRAHVKRAKNIKTLTIVTHSWAKQKPDYFAIKSDALIIFPWDYKVLIQRKWQLNPELQKAIKSQKR